MANTAEFAIVGKDRFSRAAKGVRSAINSMAKSMAVLGTATVVALGAATKSLITVGDTTEKFKLRMDAMLGSVAEGNQVFRDMTEFASEVPFAYEEIMGAATQLSGILKGGAEEIRATMPMIADLAAVSGLSIEKTTEQVVRLFSAGAGAADLFRERGINAMLGFEAGVSISAEDTRAKLIEAFEDPESKFRGAAKKMATTWTGLMSMMGDKWFAMRASLDDAGLFNFFKAIAIVLNDLMGQALDNTKKNAESWANSIIDGIRSVMSAIGFMANMFRGLQVVWIGLQVGFSKVIEIIIEGMTALKQIIVGDINFIIEALNNLPKVEIELLSTKEGGLEAALDSMRLRTQELKGELQALALESLPSEAIEAFSARVEETFVKLQEMSEAARAQVVDTTAVTAETISELMQEMTTAQEEWVSGLKDNSETFAESFFSMIDDSVKTLSKGIAGVIVEGKSMSEMFKNLVKQVLSQFISMMIQMGIQRLILSGISKTAVIAEGTSEGAKAVGLAGANMFASWAGAPWPISMGAPAAAAAAVAGASASMASGMAAGSVLGIAGAAHGGLTNVPSESTFLLDRGERVLSPSQNKDLTDFLSGGGEGGGNIAIETLNMHILENATNVDALLNMDDAEMREIVAGPIIRALDELDEQGIRPVSAERTGE